MKIILLYSALISLAIWFQWRERTKMIIGILGRQQWYRTHYTFMPSWRLARRVKFLLSGKKCSKCRTRMKIDVHHSYYTLAGRSILYWEWLMPWALLVYCRSCHEIEHDG